MLSKLLPSLGVRPDVILGTSVGAISTAFLGATAHLSLERQLEQGRELWADVDWDDVLAPLVGPGTALAGARYAGAVAGLPGVDLHALLDPAPLRRTLERWIDWEAMHRNIADGTLGALGVVATSALTARSHVFIETEGEVPQGRSEEIKYFGAEIGVDHVRASAAIPVAFPAVHLEHPEEAAGWYFDGGTRLNTPVKPAIDLGVDRVIITATHSVSPRQAGNWHTEGRQPDFGDAAVQFLFAALVDSLINDVKMLGKINLLAAGQTPQSDSYRTEHRGERPLRQIPYIFIAPPSRDCIGDVAHRVFQRHYGKATGLLRSTNLALLGRLLGGVDEPHAELLSYLMFAPEFIAAVIEQGERDAEAWLNREWGDEGPWLDGPIDTLDAVAPRIEDA